MTNTVEQLKEMAREVNGWDGSLEEFEYREDEMFRINDYGNLDSCSEDYFITELADNEDEIAERYNELVESGEIENIL